MIHLYGLKIKMLFVKCFENIDNNRKCTNVTKRGCFKCRWICKSN